MVNISCYSEFQKKKKIKNQIDKLILKETDGVNRILVFLRVFYNFVQLGSRIIKKITSTMHYQFGSIRYKHSSPFIMHQISGLGVCNDSNCNRPETTRVYIKFNNNITFRCLFNEGV